MPIASERPDYAGFLQKPNTILAVDYLKALEKLHSSIEPLPVLRPGDYHSTRIDPQSPSATAIREAIRKGEDVRAAVPDPCFRLLQDTAPSAPLDAWSEELYYRLPI